MICTYKPLKYSPISSPGGKRDVFLDITGGLEPGETITTTPTISSEFPALIAISGVAVNTAPTPDGAEIGKGVYWSIETLAEAEATVSIYVEYEGNSGSAGRYECIIEVTPTLIR